MSRRSAKNHVVEPSKPRLLQVLGPGLVTGAADDDPSGIATYSQAGAQFGFQLGWTLVLTYPLMVVIQEISARIGRTTGLGIAGNLRTHYSPWVLFPSVGSVVFANVCNIGADLGAMAEAVQLLLPRAPTAALLVLFALLCAGGQIFMHHKRYVAILKWLTLSLFSYFAVLAIVHVRWIEFFAGLVRPHFSPSKNLWLMVAAILGTTISPYLFFWQAAQEVEDTKTEPVRQPLLQRPNQGSSALARIRLDTLVGMGISNAFGLFALGIVGTGLLAVPVLAGSAAYSVGEARRWPVGLAKQPAQAKAFYATIAAATALGAIANLLKVNPIKALVLSAVLNAIAAVPVMALIMRMASDGRIMGKFKISRRSCVLGWLATAVMGVASGGYLLSLAASW
jgi:Mn2+/Fe2+ NRAMP family transporter